MATLADQIRAELHGLLTLLDEHAPDEAGRCRACTSYDPTDPQPAPCDHVVGVAHTLHITTGGIA